MKRARVHKCDGHFRFDYEGPFWVARVDGEHAIFVGSAWQDAMDYANHRVRKVSS